MRLRIAIAVIALLASACARANEPVRVPASALIAAGQDAVQLRADAEKVSVVLTPVGRVADVTLPADSVAEVSAGALTTPWLRSRIGVPVRVSVGGEKRAAMTVWFAVVASAHAPVYVADYPRGMTGDRIQTRPGDVDLAKTHAKPAADAGSLTGQRLLAPVKAGQAALAGDFETIPAISSQQAIRIESTQGVVHLSIVGRALTDGNTGDVIAVLPAGATHPVRARVISSQVVAIEN